MALKRVVEGHLVIDVAGVRVMPRMQGILSFQLTSFKHARLPAWGKPGDKTD